MIALLEILPGAALEGLGGQTGEIASQAGQAAMQLAGNPAVLIGGIVLVIAAALIFLFLKKIIVNSILGVIAWALLYYAIGVELPLLPSLAVSIIFGLAGIGAMLLLKFFSML